MKTTTVSKDHKYCYWRDWNGLILVCPAGAWAVLQAVPYQPTWRDNLR